MSLFLILTDGTDNQRFISWTNVMSLWRELALVVDYVLSKILEEHQINNIYIFYITSLIYNNESMFVTAFLILFFL